MIFLAVIELYGFAGASEARSRWTSRSDTRASQPVRLISRERQARYAPQVYNLLAGALTRAKRYPGGDTAERYPRQGTRKATISRVPGALAPQRACIQPSHRLTDASEAASRWIPRSETRASQPVTPIICTLCVHPYVYSDSCTPMKGHRFQNFETL